MSVNSSGGMGELDEPAEWDENGKKWSKMKCPECNELVPGWFTCENCGWDRRSLQPDTVRGEP